jgi:hypothetical protein
MVVIGQFFSVQTAGKSAGDADAALNVDLLNACQGQFADKIVDVQISVSRTR